MEKADRVAQGVRDKANVKKFLKGEYDAGSMGEAYEKYRDSTGMDRDSREDFERKSKEKALEASMSDQTKTPEERAREAEESRGGGGGGGGSDPMKEVVTKLNTIITEITERLPQNALG